MDDILDKYKDRLEGCRMELDRAEHGLTAAGNQLEACSYPLYQLE